MAAFDHPQSPEPTPLILPSGMQAMSTFERLVSVRDRKGAAFIVLLDPDRLPDQNLEALVSTCTECGADAFFIGSSLLFGQELDPHVERIRATTDLPLIGFPGSITQLSAQLDAVLYLSVVSGRNPEYLFGQHVHAAPIIRSRNIEPISTAYMLVESGSLTTAQYMSHSLPLPRRKPDVAAATALAAEMMGMKMLFTDGGSGADGSVPEEIISAINETCMIPLAVGGGITTPMEAAKKVEAGASFVVVGNGIERRPDASYITELASAVHVAVPHPI